ncbi:MAG: hypothetical protein KY469_04040 [Actinobacteria bacterium]|nr:hypothetical protein [Actinomycetota bacterium]
MNHPPAPDRRLRLLAAFVCIVLLIGAVVAVSRGRSDDVRAPATSAPTAPDGTNPPTPDAPAAPTDPRPGTSAPPTADLDALVDPDAAEALGAEALLALGVAAARGPWAETGHPAWPVEERPVYVATVDLDEDRDHVTADVVIAARSDADLDAIVLRLLPAAEALADAGTNLAVTVRGGGGGAPHEIDAAGARLVVDLEPTVVQGEAYLLRIQTSYDVPPRVAIEGDGGAAGFGLLAHNEAVTFLGHWLPVLTLPTDAGPMIPWGDVGAFPAAVWSVTITHSGTLLTGGVDGPCPDPAPTCTWARGIALRDVSAVAYDAGAIATDSLQGDLLVRTVVPAVAPLDEAAPRAHEEAVSAVESFTQRFGPLAWSEFDVAVAPMGTGAAGMEFPGLIVIDDSDFTQLGGEFGSFVLGHEVAHQWFHALVGNGSLSSPVVDEAAAQYLTYLWYRDHFGPAAADQLVSTYLRGRYDRYHVQGGTDAPPAQPLDAFTSAASYGAMVYARAPLAWLRAEDRLGADRVETFLDEVIERWGLGFVSDDELIDAATVFDADLGAILTRYWLEAAPIEE